MARMITVSVLYPQTATSHFNLDYYLQSHIPLVQKLWESFGLEKADIFHGTSALDGSAPAYALVGLLTFTSSEQLQAALAAHGGDVLGDIPNFTDVQPLIQINTPC